MYLAMVGDGARRHWGWAVLLVMGLELGMLLTPYPQTFGIHVTPRFIVVTMSAHLIFGVGLGLSARWLARRGAFLPRGFAPAGRCGQKGKNLRSKARSTNQPPAKRKMPADANGSAPKR